MYLEVDARGMYVNTTFYNTIVVYMRTDRLTDTAPICILKSHAARIHKFYKQNQ